MTYLSLHEESLLDLADNNQNHEHNGRSLSICSKLIGGGNTESSSTSWIQTLNLGMLACEPNPPYGPIQHTAQLLLDLISMAVEQWCCEEGKKNKNDQELDDNTETKDDIDNCPELDQSMATWMIRIHIFDVQKGEYPTNWDDFDGFLLPGSHSSAYDDEPWIARLSAVIQSELVSHQRPTLGICFGHQMMAFSFFGGSSTNSNHTDMTNNNNNCSSSSSLMPPVIPTPSGPRGGRCDMPLTTAGRQWLLGSRSKSNKNNNNNNNNNNSIDLFWSHNDMVQHIPDTAAILGGNHAVPMASVAYFPTAEAARAWEEAATNNSSNNGTMHMNNRKVDQGRSDVIIRPYAITFQGHPEYATSRDWGMYRTLYQCLQAMRLAGKITPEYESMQVQDAEQYFDSVQHDSIQLMVAVGAMLGWFPKRPALWK